MLKKDKQEESKKHNQTQESIKSAEMAKVSHKEGIES